MTGKAIGEHREIENIVKNGISQRSQVEDFRTLLENHIRSEERVIFQKIQEQATEGQLQKILDLDLPEWKEPAWDDEFWK